MQINHNIRAMVTQHSLFQNNNSMTKSLEKLSTGLKINRAQDDAAGLAMSEQMRSQIRGLGKAKQNSQDGQAALQIAEGALAEIDNILLRQKELSVQAATDTLSATERKYLNDEFQELTKEIDRIARTTDYNGKNVLVFNPDPDKSFGAVKQEIVTKNQVSEDAISMLQKYFGGDLSKGFSFIGSGGKTDEIKAVNDVIDKLNQVLTTLAGAPTADNIKKVLEDLKTQGADFKGDKIKFDLLSSTGAVKNLSSISGISSADVATIKKINQFMEEVYKADSLLTVLKTFTQTYTADAKAFALFSEAKGTLPGNWEAALHTISGDGNYAALADAIGRVKSAVDAATNASSMDSIFGSGASDQMQKDLRLISDFDTSKMTHGTDYTQKTTDQARVTSWQRAIESMKEAYGEKSAVGTAGSEILHVGPNYSKGLAGPEGNEIKVNYTSIDTKGLGIARQDISSQAGATKATDQLDAVIKEVSGVRAKIGTYINRLDSTINNIASLEYNTQDAESRIRDTDFAKETTNFTRNQIMVQSATSMLAQANSLPQSVLGLIG